MAVHDMATARPWLGAYPPGVPAEIDESSLGTVADLFARSVREHGPHPALESFGKRVTYDELGRAAGAVAGWLQQQGLRRGDRVAIMMPNVLAYPPVLFGVLQAGCIVVNVNPLYTARELAHQLHDSGAKVLFVLENFAHTVEEALPHMALERIVVATPGDLMGVKGLVVNLVSRRVKKAVKPYKLPAPVAFSTVLATGGVPKPVPLSGDDVAVLQYTGGTTGVAKAATLLHRNVAANVEQCAAWFAPALAGGTRHIMVTALPLYHIFALTACCLLMMRVGACCLLIANPRDLDGFIKTLKTRPFTIMTGVNTLYNALAGHASIREVDFSKLALCIAGGMATQAAVAKRWKDLTGKAIVEGYGLSETSPVVCCNRLDLEEFSGTIGYPVPSTEVDARRPDGSTAPQGEPGELCVRGPQVMAGYWNRPDETAAVTEPDGFFRTGDVAVILPDGQVRIVDRMKDMVLVSGFNVYPNEVEDVLAAHRGVMECAVTGRPDATTGEMVVAHVVRSDPSVTAEELRAFCRESLTAYKVPKLFVFRDALPKTPVGKVLRRALKDEHGTPASD